MFAPYILPVQFWIGKNKMAAIMCKTIKKLDVYGLNFKWDLKSGTFIRRTQIHHLKSLLVGFLDPHYTTEPGNIASLTETQFI